MVLLFFLLRGDGGRGTNSNKHKNKKNPYATSPGATVTCPSGYLPCTDNKFNKGYTTGIAKLLEADKFYPNQLCCKFGNALQDPRPSCMQSVKKAQKTFGIVMIVVEVMLSFMPGFGSFAADVVSGLGFSVLAAESGGWPMRDCCTVGSDPKKKTVIKRTFKGEDGKDSFAYYTTDNGCPIVMGTPEWITYTRQLTKAFDNAPGINDATDPWILTFDKWDPKKKPIWCWPLVVTPSEGNKMGYKCDQFNGNPGKDAYEQCVISNFKNQYHDSTGRTVEQMCRETFPKLAPPIAKGRELTAQELLLAEAESYKI